MKTGYWPALASILCLAGLAFVVNPVPAQTAPAPTATPLLDNLQPPPKRIQFEPGASSGVVTGSLAPSGMDRYILGALAGQTMTVSVSSTTGPAILVIWGADGTVLVSDHAGTASWSGRLPASQDYIVDVEAGPDAPARYTLQIAIPPLPGQGPAAKRIKFAPGSTSAVVEGNLAPDGVDRYVLRALAGQTMTVSVSSSTGEATLAIWGVDGSTLVSDQAGTGSWNGQLVATGDYTVEVRAAPGAPASYSLLVIIPPLAPGQTREVTEQDAGSTVQLQVGDTLEVILHGNITTGYTWETQSVDSSILQQVGSPVFTSTGRALGAGGTFTIQYMALAPGTTQLQLIYHRPFEQGVPPAQTFVIGVDVMPATAAPPPTTAPPPTPTPAACANVAAFVADVTVPADSTISPGQSFNKVWRVLNTGTCGWEANTQLIFVSGDAMSATNAVAVPFTPPGASADLAVPMVAPAAPGTYEGHWQLWVNGTLFGPVLVVRINVPAPPPPPPPTCSGTPNITSFSASTTTIAPGQSVVLSWGPVLNADQAQIDQGIGGVATPGSTVVAPGQTTTYTMQAFCGANTAIAQVTIFVVVPTPTATPSPPAPTASFLQPSDGFVVPDNQPLVMTFAAHADARLKKLEVFGNGTLLTTISKSNHPHDTQEQFSWQPVLGSYQLQLWVVAFDESGQTGQSAVVTGNVVAVAAPPPTATPTPPPLSHPPTPVPPPQPHAPNSMGGVWHSAMNGGNLTLNLQLGACSPTVCNYGGSATFKRKGTTQDGSIQATFDGTTFRCNINGIQRMPSFGFTGTLSADGRTLRGDWSVSNQPLGSATFNKQ